ncbi:MAG: hypothetical protein K2K56_13935 [Lachnospiraceae bacterium]|nr:hypothetical protein [Lachnospiraceae bacterium]
MNADDYRRVMKQIRMSEDKRQQIWKQIENSTGQKRKGINLIKTAVCISMLAAVSFCFILMQTDSVTAGNIMDFFEGIFSIKENSFVDQSEYDMRERVEKHVYSDQDEHIKMDVLEMLSDGMTTYFTVKYTGLDSVGCEWLTENHYSFFEQYLNMDPVFPDGNTAQYGVNYGCLAAELAEYAEKNEKYFIVIFNTSSVDYQSKNGIFQYPMHDGQREKILPLANNIQFQKYELICDGLENLYYEPRYLYVSGLSFIVYGSKKENFDILLADPRSEIYEGNMVVEIESADITHILNKGYWKFAGINPNENNGFSNMLIASGCFYTDEESSMTITTFDPENVQRIKVAGIEYKVKKVQDN